MSKSKYYNLKPGQPLSPEIIKGNAKKYAEICYSTWSPIIRASALGLELWEQLFIDFADHQLFYQNEAGDWLGFANTIPIYYQAELKDLPEEGWDWLFAKGFQDHREQSQANILGGLQIGINPKYRGQGWSKKILEAAKRFCQSKGYQRFILPIRPTLKDQHPEVEMEEYLHWKKDEKIYDPWIRTHVQSGASIIKVCHQAMLVEGSIADWEKWSGQKFTSTGQYQITGGLTLVNIDLEKNQGRYEEPNIWTVYE